VARQTVPGEPRTSSRRDGESKHADLERYEELPCRNTGHAHPKPVDGSGELSKWLPRERRSGPFSSGTLPGHGGCWVRSSAESALKRTAPTAIGGIQAG
jgi:hypothetical protein